MVGSPGRQTDEEPMARCDYCRLPCSSGIIRDTYQEVEYTFCSKHCREALETSERVFTEYHGSKRFQPEVTPFETMCPDGVPRNSFILLSHSAGTRTEAFQAELAWRALQRDEPVIMAVFLEPPVSLIHQFVAHDWNPLPYLEQGRLQILDCFNYRVEDRERMFDRMNEWNTHLHAIAREATTTVQDPTETSQLQNGLDACVERQEMNNTGLVVIDSLTEYGTMVQPINAYRFIKDIRAEVCKGRFVPIVAGATIREESDEFPHDLNYMADGVIDMRLNNDLVEDTLVKEIRVRKLERVQTESEWIPFEFSREEGLTLVDPTDDDPQSNANDSPASSTQADIG